MKRFYLLLVFLELAFLSLQAQKIDVYKRPLQYEPSHDFDALHYRIKLDFNEARKTFRGENTITLVSLCDDFQTCILDAVTFTVSGVEDLAFNPLNFEHIDQKLHVYLHEPAKYGDTVSFTVHYISENVKADPEKFGMGRNYALGLTFLDETTSHPSLIQALSFPTGARHWYPCYDHPHDKATQEIIATVNNSYNLLSNGRLVDVSEDTANQTKTFHWSLEQPHSTYLSMLIAGSYEVIKDAFEDLPINYWVYPKDVDNALRSFHKTPAIIDFFSKEYGYNYPWPKYDQITIPGIGGGAECTSATLIGQGTIHDEKAEQDFPSHWLVAHEAAHQWWGDLVTCRDWGHTWLNESFGTYSEYLFSKHELGEEEGAVNLLNKKNQYLDEAHNRYIRPIVFHRWEYPNQNFDSHTYPKGAVVLHMMRWILGDKPFRATLIHFLEKHAFKPVDTHDFYTAVKEATGQNLDWFFDQWLYRPGHPVFNITYKWNGKNKKLILTIDQVQDTSKGIPVYRTPVIIGITTSTDKRSHKIWLEKESETYEFECSEQPLLVRFDEGNYLLKEWTFTKSRDEILFQLRHDDVTGRMWAASELSKYSSEKEVREALTETAKTDPFWSVRRVSVETLGNLKDRKLIKLFKEVCYDQNSIVRRAAIQSLGKLNDTSLVIFLTERVENENSYVAKAEAIRALGGFNDKSLRPLFEEMLTVDSPRNIIKRAAEWAIAQLPE
ncbi:MAG: M1 family metallopeptidase [Bacteroidales bacterium]|nr:MAG: M1 family metallopeptidase [Bacteroidales bacterium]